VNATEIFVCKNVLWNVGGVQTKITRHRLARLVLGLALLKKGIEENCSDPLFLTALRFLNTCFCVSESQNFRNCSHHLQKCMGMYSINIKSRRKH